MSIKTLKILPVISLALFALVFLLRPGIASAHQPRIVEDRVTVVTEPEISKAYYGKLEGCQISTPSALAKTLTFMWVFWFQIFQDKRKMYLS